MRNTEFLKRLDYYRVYAHDNYDIVKAIIEAENTKIGERLSEIER